MKNKFLPFLILLFLLSCKTISNTNEVIENPSVNVTQSVPIEKNTNIPSTTPFKTHTDSPVRTISPQSTSIPLIAHWIINTIDEQNMVYVLGEDLNIIGQFPDFLGDAFVDSQNCQIIRVSSHFEKQTGLHNSPGFEIEWMTLTGNQIEQKLIKYPHDPYNLYEMRISPSMEWVAYKQSLNWEGLYSISDSQTQDVFVIPIEFTKEVKPVQITMNSGAWNASISWSPDGRFLAFTDFDQSGNQQINIYEPASGQKKQITNLESKVLETYVLDFHWTMDSKNIFFISGQAINNDQQFLNTTFALGKINVESNSITWIYPENEIPLKIIGVGNTGLLVIKEGSNNIVWYETITNRVIHQYELDDRLYVFLEDDKAETIISNGYPYIKIYNINEGELRDSEFSQRLGLFQTIKTIDNEDYFNCEVK